MLGWSVTWRTALEDGVDLCDAIGTVQEVNARRSEEPDSLQFVHLGPLSDRALMPHALPWVMLTDELTKGERAHPTRAPPTSWRTPLPRQTHASRTCRCGSDTRSVSGPSFYGSPSSWCAIASWSRRCAVYRPHRTRFDSPTTRLGSG